MPRPIRATISAGALAHNLAVARGHAGGAKVWAVIKANAYGHGVERAARAMAAADGFAVLDFQEAARLRATGVTQPILLLEGFFRREDLADLVPLRLTPVVHNPEQVAKPEPDVGRKVLGSAASALTSMLVKRAGQKAMSRRD